MSTQADMPIWPPEGRGSTTGDTDDPTGAGYEHQQWCHVDMDCCGCTCVDIYTQVKWGWI